MTFSTYPWAETLATSAATAAKDLHNMISSVMLFEFLTSKKRKLGSEESTRTREERMKNDELRKNERIC